MQTIIQNRNWQEQQAFERYALIAPLLDETIDSARRSQLRREIALKAKLLECTLYRYEADQDARSSSLKRFCKPHRMMLLQGDIKYGCKLPMG